MTSGGFDRIKPPERRLLERPEGSQDEPDERAPGGRSALFSAGSGPQRNRGMGLSAHCGRCRSTTPLDLSTALRSAFPLFLVAPWKRHGVFAVCPACRRRAWLHVGPARSSWE